MLITLRAERVKVKALIKLTVKKCFSIASCVSGSLPPSRVSLIM